MSLTRCPQCGRVADGRSCFACGYEWPKAGATTVPPPASSAQAPMAPAARTGPFASPLAPPRAPTPMSQQPASPPPQQTGNLSRKSMPSPSPQGSSPFGQPSTSPFASGPPSTNPFTSAPPSPFGQQQPFAQPPPPPPMDEIVIDTDISFSLMSDALPPSAGGLPQPPPGMPPPPMQAFPAPPAGLPPPPMPFASMPPNSTAPSPFGARPPAPPSDGGIPSSTLDTIFDGIDISVPTSPARMNDPAMEAGDFMIDIGPPPEPPPPPPLGDGDWAASSALGADLLAAFNNAGDATESEIPVAQGQAFPSFDDGPGLPPPGLGPDPMVQFSTPTPPITDRLSALAQRLRSEGRTEEADVVTEAMALINLQS